MDEAEHAARARSFDAAAAAYQRGRPTYPEAAIDWVLDGLPAPAVLDLGAGTGKLTGQLAARGLPVIAVEPLDRMRELIAESAPGVPAVAGTAEAIPLPDDSVDVVFAGQAFHWFDRARALPEIARVLRPGGVFAPLWNLRDDRVPWVGALSELIGSEDNARPVVRELRLGPGWVEEAGTFPSEQELDLPGLLDMVQSRSQAITLPPGERAALLDRVAAFTRERPELAGHDRWRLPYVTRAYRARVV